MQTKQIATSSSLKSCISLLMMLAVLLALPLGVHAWDTGLTIFNFSSGTVWVTFRYASSPTCKVVSKSYPSVFAPNKWIDHGWGFDSGCALSQVEVRQNNASGTILASCNFTPCSTSTQCPGSYVTVSYNTQLSTPLSCQNNCNSKGWNSGDCWK
jgi:hypothetical protein